MPKRVPVRSMTAAGIPSCEGKQRFVDVGHQNAVHDEARRALAGQRQLVELASELQPRLAPLGPRGGAFHDLHQLHLRHGIEEMDPHQPAGVLSFSAKVSILMLEVLVANIAFGLSRGSSSA